MTVSSLVPQPPPDAFQRSDVQLVRRNPWWLLLASAPWMFGLVMMLMAFATGEAKFLLPVGHAAILGTLAFFYAYRKNANPRFQSGALRITAEAVFFGDRKLCDRRDISGGLVVPRKDGRLFVRLSRKRKRPALLFAVDSEAAGRDVLRALELDASQSVAEMRGMSQYFALPAWKQMLIVAAPVLAAFAGFVSGAVVFGPAGAAFGVVGLLVTMIATATMMIAPTRISIGADGILTRWLGRRRFFAFSETERVDPIEKRVVSRTYLGVQITNKSGETTFIPIGEKGWRDEEFATTVERIRQAIEVYKSGHIGANASALERRGRAPADWIIALRSVGAGANVGMRTAPVSAEQLLRIVEDAGAEPGTRASAAVALAARGSEHDRHRIRIAAEATAAPKLRIALQKAAEPEIADEELGTLLAELEVESAS